MQLLNHLARVRYAPRVGGHALRDLSLQQAERVRARILAALIARGLI
jgi:hypothetical protein